MELVLDFKIWKPSSSNVSAHVPVEMMNNIHIPNCDLNKNYSNKIRQIKRLIWEKIGQKSYKETIQKNIHIFLLSGNTKDQLKSVTNALLRASSKSVPSKVVKLCGPKWKASPSVRKQLKTCKTLYSKWKSSGQNMDHHTYLDLVKEKQKLKSTQRMEKAIDRTHLYKKIMENPSTDLFYRLINRNRKKTKCNTACMKIDGKLDYSVDDQRHAFARYYEDLSVAKEDAFDSTYWELCKVRQNLVEQFY